MSPRSTAITLLYVFMSAMLVGCFTIGETQYLIGSWGLDKSLSDIFSLLALLAFTLVSLQVGCDRPIVLTVGTIAGFIILTYFQPELIRYLSLAAVLFSIGTYGMVVSRNAVRVLMSIELMLNAVNINLVAFARYVDPTLIQGQVFAIFILTVAAAEAAVGLAIVLAIYRNMATVDMEKFNLLKW